MGIQNGVVVLGTNPPIQVPLVLLNSQDLGIIVPSQYQVVENTDS